MADTTTPPLPITLDDVLYRVEAVRTRLGDSADALAQADLGELAHIIEDAYHGLDETTDMIESAASRTRTPTHPGAQRLF